MATLKPLTPRRAFLWSGFLNPGIFIVDADKGEMEGYLPKSDWSSFAIAPGGKAYYVAETLWTHDTRGQRQDMITVYDGTTLNLQKEIALPGRALTVPKAQSFAVNGSGHYGYVYNLSPASSVVVVDLVKQRTVATVETPGCALVLPYGESGFGSLCGDGSLSTFGLDAQGARYPEELGPLLRLPSAIRCSISSPSMSPRTRYFSSPIWATSTRPCWRISREWRPAWSLQAAAGLSEPKDESDEVAWRPGGSQLIAFHPAERPAVCADARRRRLVPQARGAELWVLNAATHALIRRIGLKEAAANVAVTQDAEPWLLLTGRGPKLTVLDPDSGNVIRTVDAVNGGPIMTAMP